MLQRRDHARGGDADGLHLDAAAQAAAGLHAGGPGDRHARAQRRDLGYEGSKPRQVLITEADLPRVLAALDRRRPDGDGRQRLASRRDGRDRCNATRGAHERSYRRVRDRGADEDPGEVPEGARERRVGAAAGARRSSRASCAHSAGAGPRREGAGRGIPPELRTTERGGAGADRLHPAQRPLGGRVPGSALARVHGASSASSGW